MDREQDYLLKVVKYVLHNREIEIPVPAESLDWNKVLETARRHSIPNLLFYGIEKLDDAHQPEEKIIKYLQDIMMQELIRSYNQMDAAQELQEAFEKEGLYVLALKGVNTKRYYSESDMRSMGDIDILYQESQHERMKAVMEELGYEGYQEGRKHDHYQRLPYIGIELHRELVAAESEFSAYYSDIWSRVHPREGCTYIRKMSLEDEYIYTIVHLVDHFKRGGVGIRFIMDLYVYNHLEQLDRDYLKCELEKLKLWDFYRNVSAVAEMWFGIETQEYTQEELQMLNELSDYIIANGTYGSKKDAAALSVEKSGRFRFLLSACFPSLKEMQSMYPWLRKLPVLLPVSWVMRGVRSILFRRNNIRSQMNVYKNGDMNHGKKLKQFYERCGL